MDPVLATQGRSDKGLIGRPGEQLEAAACALCPAAREPLSAAAVTQLETWDLDELRRHAWPCLGDPARPCGPWLARIQTARLARQEAAHG